MKWVVVFLFTSFLFYSCSGPALEELLLLSLGTFRCPDCAGTGKVKCTSSNCYGGYAAAETTFVSILLGFPIPIKCRRCGGTGWIVCPRCRGRGYIY